EDAAAWRAGPPPRPWAHRLHRGGGRPAGRFAYVPLHRVSAQLCLAVLVAEDTGFFWHGTLDYTAIWEALLQWRQGRPLRGASTISQQLAKNLFFSSERSLWRKLQEARMAAWLERHLGKRRIFELYVNIIELGPAVFGVQAAAQTYLQKDASQCSAAQAALLAATIPAPRVANPQHRGAAFEARRAVVVQRMQRLQALRRHFE
ncbi:MAG: monofunctional biosynthetic peptidoglycan transglycosylase, partial [Deltaproteobacteria bacterium]